MVIYMMVIAKNVSRNTGMTLQVTEVKKEVSLKRVRSR